MKLSKIKEKQKFIYQGKIYQFINENGNWRKLCDEFCNAVDNQAPTELFISNTEVPFIVKTELLS